MSDADRMSATEHCSRAKSDMTPCVRRDEYAVADDGVCVGCGLPASEVADELRAIAQEAVDMVRYLANGLEVLPDGFVRVIPEAISAAGLREARRLVGGK
jgi:hypothetical protein